MVFRSVCIFVLLSLHAFSQRDLSAKKNAKHANDSIAKQKDLGDVFKGKFFEPFFGKPDKIAKQKGKVYKALLPGVGYTQATQFYGGISLAASFYTDHP